MKESEMKEIAQLMHRVVVRGEDPAKVGKTVNEFRKEFTRVHYAFESTRDAYEYIQLR
jgi:glycine hydroxymethyltransferase